MHIIFPDTFTWEEIVEVPTEDGQGEADGALDMQCGRAGHAAAIVGTRMYICSGRERYNKSLINQVSQS